MYVVLDTMSIAHCDFTNAEDACMQTWALESDKLGSPQQGTDSNAFRNLAVVQA